MSAFCSTSNVRLLDRNIQSGKVIHVALLLLMLEAATNADLVSTISQRRNTPNLLLSTSGPADYPICLLLLGLWGLWATCFALSTNPTGLAGRRADSGGLRDGMLGISFRVETGDAAGHAAATRGAAWGAGCRDFIAKAFGRYVGVAAQTENLPDIGQTIDLDPNVRAVSSSFL
jgi:hypothetical protein